MVLPGYNAVNVVYTSNGPANGDAAGTKLIGTGEAVTKLIWLGGVNWKMTGVAVRIPDVVSPKYGLPLSSAGPETEAVAGPEGETGAVGTDAEAADPRAVAGTSIRIVARVPPLVG